MLEKIINRTVILICIIVVFLILGIYIIQSESQETPTVSFPESSTSIEPYLERIDGYEQDGEYGEAITVAKKAIEIFPSDDRGYSKLKHLYILTGRYADAIKINQKLVELAKATEHSSGCGYLRSQAALFEYAGRQEEAIEVLEQYRKDCPRTVEEIITGLREAMSKGERYFPSLPGPGRNCK